MDTIFYPKLTVVVPIHNMKNGDYFLGRLQDSLEKQTFTDFEIIITKNGKMAENTNSAIELANAELIKILYMDDYLAHENSLQEIIDNFGPNDMWLATGCTHTTDGVRMQNDHYPFYSQDIHRGNNTIGSPSVLTIRNRGHLLFDENLSWLLDCDLYKRYYDVYGPPKLLNTVNVVLGIGSHQSTNVFNEEFKLAEYQYLAQKYA